MPIHRDRGSRGHRRAHMEQPTDNLVVAMAKTEQNLEIRLETKLQLAVELRTARGMAFHTSVALGQIRSVQ
jgi:hypothetical protein